MMKPLCLPTPYTRRTRRDRRDAGRRKAPKLPLPEPVVEINIHGAIDLENGKTKMLEVLTVNALSTIALLMAIMIMYPTKRLIHVFLDNARYHHAQMVQEWLARPECRIRLHFIPTYCPHLDPIERLWGLMHKNVTHNRCYAKFNDFCNAVLGFLRDEVPRNWRVYCDSVSDNFRIINSADFRVLKA